VDYRKFLRQNGRALETPLRRVAAITCAGLIATLTILHARKGGQAPVQGGQAPVRTAAASQPLVPAATSSIAADPEAYYGQFVTIMATVDMLVAANAFTVDQDRTRTASPILVVSSVLTAPVTVNTYVTVMGDVVRFEADEIARRTNVQLPPDVIAAHTGRPVLLATSVLTAALVDLAKRLPPPVTAEEEGFDRLMKRVNPAFAAARQAVTDSNTDAARAQAAILKQAFSETESFWKLRGKADAVKWALEARGHAEALERAAAGADWDAAKAATAGMQQSCSSCHAVYRERFDDGSYRIRGEK
jgi:hypothetical protein